MSKYGMKTLWVWGLFVVAPLQIGAKGCDALVGNEPKPCGGLRGLACAEDEFCDYAPDALCGAADATGVCRSVPSACTFEYAPVCGCDGLTYGNRCEAQMAGVSVVREGECEGGGEQLCGGLRGAACDRGEFCSYAPEASCGAADRTGICLPVPDACDAVYAPVCGCDDRTYGNACEANRAGVSVAREGACDGGGEQACGGLRGLPCDAGEFCNYAPDAACGFADATGTCAQLPQACTTIYLPVCGCDGRTYGNSCEANRAGVSVASEGECDGGGEQACGGLRGLTCDRNEFCDYAPEALCGRADATGVCRALPEACDLIYAPVCGCDDRTYGNDCEANRAGVSVAHEGECESTEPAFCGGIAGFACDEGEFCDYTPEALCGAADAGGTCLPMPEVCTDEYDPVCGCDDNTYGNRCSAHAAGVSVRSSGGCR